MTDIERGAVAARLLDLAHLVESIDPLMDDGEARCSTIADALRRIADAVRGPSVH